MWVKVYTGVISTVEYVVLNMEFVRWVLNICIDSIAISTACMLELQRSPSHHSIALILSVSRVLHSLSTFSTQKQVGTLKLPDATALRSTSHRPNEASWHQWALCLPTQKINFEWFPKHACTNYFLVCKGRWNIYKICLKCTQVCTGTREHSDTERMTCSSLSY